MNRRTVILSVALLLATAAAAVALTGCETDSFFGTDDGSLFVAGKESTVPAKAMSGPGGLGMQANFIAPKGLVKFQRIAPGEDSPPSEALLASADFDELWVVARPTVDAPPTDELPGGGAMVTTLPHAPTEQVPLPLKHTDVSASISGYIATVAVTQQFHNPFDSKIEAQYVFPLPQNAAVNDFVMTIGDRRIRGVIRPRQQAEEIYREARSRGHVVSLLTQERPNIFTQKVANIEPGRQIDVNIKYFQTLTYVDGYYQFMFPMVVGPRFNPSHSDGIGAVPRGAHGRSGQQTEVQYLRPNERSGHDIALKVQIDAGVPIEQLTCTSHVISQTRVDDHRVQIALAGSDTIPNKDFVLQYRVAGRRIKSNIMVHRDGRVPGGGFFSLMIFPPAQVEDLPRRATEMVFVLDCSGSMNGFPIEKAKGALSHALNRLHPDDTFQVIRFSNSASQLGPTPLPATRANIDKALDYVRSLRGGGGTMMIEGIKAALDFPHDESRLRFVTFLTDGYIGNEAEILGEMHQRLGSARVFSFGIGSSPNRFLLERMAVLGCGAVAYVGPRDDSEKIMHDFQKRASHAALTDVHIEWGSLQVSDVYPKRLGDLYVGRPVIVTGRFRGDERANVRVFGRLADRQVQFDIPVDLDDPSANHPALAAVWARKKIADLTNQSMIVADPHGELAATIEQTALDYNLMSAHTAFVAVDSTRRTQGDHGTTVGVAVPVPEGVRYETTVQE